MKRALLLLALCSACAQQDPALLLTMSGPFRIPADADKLSVDVFDGTQVIKHKSWCATAAPDCDALPAQPALNGSITLVQSGSAHPRVKINAELRLGTAVVGLGSATADFQPGRTADVAIPLARP